MLYNKKEGLLKSYNLWSFWEKIPPKSRDKILNYFESIPPVFWDYKRLFIGDNFGGIEHGPIHCLDTLFEIDDLELCDLFFSKFIKYSSDNYLKDSIWGESRNSQSEKIINSLHESLLNRTEISEKENLEKIILYHSSLLPKDIYWVDTHFFLNKYSQKVYKHL